MLAASTWGWYEYLPRLGKVKEEAMSAPALFERYSSEWSGDRVSRCLKGTRIASSMPFRQGNENRFPPLLVHSVLSNDEII